MNNRKVRIGKTAWMTLRALIQNGGRGHVNYGRRYAEISPGRAVIFSQAYHSLFAQRLITRKGCNHPGDAVITDLGIVAYLRGSIESRPMRGPFLDEAAAEPFAAIEDGFATPSNHKWAREVDRIERALLRRSF